jgi:hypothetical protein
MSASYEFMQGKCLFVGEEHQGWWLLEAFENLNF